MRTAELIESLIQPTKVCDPFLADLNRLVRKEGERMDQITTVDELEAKVDEMIDAKKGDFPVVARALVRVLQFASEGDCTPYGMARAIGRIQGTALVAFDRLGIFVDIESLHEQKKNATPVTG